MAQSIYSMNDVYPNGSDSQVLTVSEQTIPTHDEANYSIDNQVTQQGSDTPVSTITTSDSSMIWGSLLLLFGLLVALHFMH
jgi:hypothetical protein